MKELILKIKALQARAADLKSKLDLAGWQKQIIDLEAEMATKDFWLDNDQARQVSQKAADLKSELSYWSDLEDNLQSLLELAEMEDESLMADLEKQLSDLEIVYGNLEIKTMLAGKYDNQGAVMSIYAGAGGDDAQDWAAMILRMYLRYIEKKNWKAVIIEESKGSEAGLKSVTLEISGYYAYGYLKAESGVHRLVRLSPFDADQARHTSFAMVEVIPVIGKGVEIELKDEDLKIDTFRASGHGGQSVNTTDSAVRITHLPTKLTATCQNERSQLQNKETALKILKGKLARFNEAKQEEEKQRLRGEFTEAAWGNQIRSYVLHPYKMVKDHRTDYEVKEPSKVLDGDLDQFIEVYLKSQIE
ncbi:MAG: peptide chain release factor 2 [Candidatus Komeilibacteria bacterium CG10_big_fil_rev_8_21_14_0_10_41_13]|uniref:Peptide chain release factor 2 n=1 Tax=Candidatus Komeilibacteria bacterium CG10_big_fil_rev_8_21_14_0_10_41_13 TaxID=1974476 RepID=A0A2M6WC97_9BACT|nr:MAG: peptide chain release factor 2 [Candidatus Komeilibacteria bacterium CG10_big_fil_rev_8_21_14_0_10_41_13]